MVKSAGAKIIEGNFWKKMFFSILKTYSGFSCKNTTTMLPYIDEKLIVKK